MGIARTQEALETTFMYKKQPKEKTEQKFSCHIYIKNKLLSYASCYKNKTKE